jgi:methyl-accepting chemotaxis protein
MANSITLKILSILVTVFVAVLVTSISVQNRQQRELVDTVISQQLTDKASNYFDSLNMMMLTGTMHQKDTLRNKALEDNNIESVRVLRADSVSALYGPGQEYQRPQDEYDQRALSGELVVNSITRDWGQGIVVSLPMLASEDYRGTNCLTCHLVAEGEVLGAIRIEYNLAALNKMMLSQTTMTVVIMVTLAIIGLIFAMFALKRILVKRIQHTVKFMNNVSSTKDLSTRLPTDSKDELGTLAQATNHVLETFSDSLSRVYQTSHSLAKQADELTEVANLTAHAASNQNEKTDEIRENVATNQNQQHQISNSLILTTEQIGNTSQFTQTSVENTHHSSDEIKALVHDIEQVKEQISDLNQQTEQVSSILDVIKAVAEQTNLLALNAAIEAARAGEQGRGFAVVADEVRNLASRTQEAANNIENIIGQFKTGSANSLNAVDQVCVKASQRSESLEDVSNSLSNVVLDMQQVISNTQEIQTQTTSQNDLNDQILEQMDTIAGHATDTSNLANRSQSVSSNLQSLSNQLEHLLAQFTLTNNNNAGK